MGKRKPNNTVDLVTPTSARHVKKKPTQQEADKLQNFEVITSSCSSGSLPLPQCEQGSKGKNICYDAMLKKLNSEAFEYYLQKLWRDYSEDIKSSFMYLDCLWFSSYFKATFRDKVLKWIKKKQIFSKKYVFVPIVRWKHWNLLIFCHFGESMQSERRKPCMLLLDSLQNASPRRLEPDIRKFVLDIYKAEGRPETEDFIYKIPLLVPKVPQQRNDEDCGNFVLYFINSFVENAPETFSIKDYPYFRDRENLTQRPARTESSCRIGK